MGGDNSSRSSRYPNGGKEIMTTTSDYSIVLIIAGLAFNALVFGWLYRSERKDEEEKPKAVSK